MLLRARSPTLSPPWVVRGVPPSRRATKRCIQGPAGRDASRYRKRPESMHNLARSRGQTQDPLVHVTELMLPPLSARIGLLCCGVLVCFSTLLTGQTPSPQSGEYNIGGAISGDQDFP